MPSINNGQEKKLYKFSDIRNLSDVSLLEESFRLAMLNHNSPDSEYNDLGYYDPKTPVEKGELLHVLKIITAEIICKNTNK